MHCRSLAVAAFGLTTAATTAFALEASGPLVDTGWLAKNLQDKTLVVLDVRADTTSFAQKPAPAAPALPGMNPCGAKKAGPKETAGHIPGARLWDWKTVRVKRVIDGVELDGMVPTKEQFETVMRDLGVNNDSVVVITADWGDTPTLAFATRAYWTLKYYGYDKVALLDGGTFKWNAERRPVSTDTSAAIAKGDFSVRTERRDLLATTPDVEVAVASQSAQLVDGRTADFFLGQSQKDYVFAKGHIPGSRNLAHTELIDSQTHALKPIGELQKIAATQKVDAAKPMIVYCDSGHLSSGPWFVFHELLGDKSVKLYDGSMHEWTKRQKPATTASN